MHENYKVMIYVTNEYGRFKSLLGNREVTETRVNNIKNSIETIGYISSPVIVNEKMEVIDGQGRLEALKRLKMPVEYRIIPGLTVNDCQALNLKNGGWSVGDFVKSYADLGDATYINMMRLKKQYGFSYTIILSIATGKAHGGHRTNMLRDKQFSLTAEDVVRLDNTLKFLSELKDVQKTIGGRSAVFYTKLAWIYTQPGVDTNRLRYSVRKYASEIREASQDMTFLNDVSKVYNKGISKDKWRSFSFEWSVKK